MLLPKFEFHEPRSVEDACQILAEIGPEAKPLAGGTDLLVNMKKKLISPKALVSLARVETLKTLEPSGGKLMMGSCVTAARLAESKTVTESFPALAKAGQSLGSPLIRNLATLGGNVISARPAADLPPALMAYGGRVILKGAYGERRLPLRDFFQGPGQTVLRADEILTALVLDEPAPGSGAGYMKLGVRQALEISLVNVAAFLAMDGRDGAVKKARIVLGSVAPTPVRAYSAEEVLMGERPTEALFSRAGEAALKDIAPIDDFRASADYKRAMVAVLTRRALREALEGARP